MLEQLDFRELAESSPDPIGVLDGAHLYLYGNAAVAQISGVPTDQLLGKRGDACMSAPQAQAWHAALDDVLQTGCPRQIECLIDTPAGVRRFAVRLTRLREALLSARWRDITELHAGRLLAIAAQSMTTGMVVVEAPSGSILFQNDETEHAFGKPSRTVHGREDYDAIRAYDAQGRLLDNDGWPVSRALRGDTLVDERIEVDRDDGRRTISINASPVRDPQGVIRAAVATYHDITEAKRAHDAARYLAEASALLERFEPATSLQAIVELAVPVLADWCFIHIATDLHPTLAAIAHADPEQAAAARARGAVSQPLSAGTAVARVLAGGGPEIIASDPAGLERSARAPAHLAELRAPDYRSAVVAPLAGRDGVLGAITFAMADSGRVYRDADLDVLTELARRTGSALDNARLLSAERGARQHAEEARDRTRRLQALTEVLSGAVEKDAVMTIMVSAGRDALGAGGGFAWLLKDESTLELAAVEHGGKPGRIAGFRTIDLSTPLPVCDVVRTGQSMMFADLAAMTAQYPLANPPGSSPFRAWAVMPVVIAGQAIGAVTFAFLSPRKFSVEDRDLLTAMIGQGSLALDRCLLIDAERRARARERQLHGLAARLSSALTPAGVAAIACEEAVSVLRAYSGAAAIRVGDEMQILGTAGPRDDAALALVERIPLAAVVPIAEAVRTSELVWCASEAELAARYSHLEPIWKKLGIRSWGAVPFSFEERTMGSLALSCSEERVLDDGEREFLRAVGQLAAQALERARLYDALRSSEEQLRVALGAARAGTWSLDLATMISKRDPSYLALVSQLPAESAADFLSIHPDDRPIAQAELERALRDGLPYEPEFRMRRDDGSYLWVRAHGRVVCGPDGKPRTLAGVIIDIDQAKRVSLRAEEDRKINETLHRLGTSFASELDHDRLVQLITDEVTKLVGAEAGAFLSVPQGGTPTSFRSMAATDAAQLEELTHSSATPLLAETLFEQRVVRLDDLCADPRFAGQGLQPGRPARIRSYLAVPVSARSDQVFGGLVFGHTDVGRFSAEQARLAASIARQAAVALENARLYQTVRQQKEQLELAIERAHVADRRKDEFLAMLGHELRNPLAPIVTALALMDRQSESRFEKERAVIRRQVQHLTRLVDDLLDVSRITGGKLQLSVQRLELGLVLAKAIETVSPLLEKRSQRLVLDAPRTGLLVDADPTRLAQVLQNLLTNAAKYSDPGSSISLRARAHEDRILVQVQDTGLGIPEELMSRIFDLFVQGERRIDRSQGGLGLGLTIAKRLCELHGGTIHAESDGPGRGSTFTVSLPPAVPVSASLPSEEDSSPRPTTRRKRVLVVDDNVDAALTLQELLLQLGHEAAVAHDGLVALDLASSFQPTVALLDIGLPVMDGYELARKLRDDPGAQKLLLIAITGYGQDQDRWRTRQAGFDHHLVKPIDLRALLALLDV